LDSTSFDAWKSLGLIQSKQGKHQAAIKAFKKAMALNAGDKNVQMKLAAEYKDAGQDSLAIAQYKKIITANPKDHVPHYNLANIYRDNGNHNAAIKEYQAAVGANPNYINALYNLAISKQTVEDYEGALGAYKNFVAKAKGKSRWSKRVNQANDVIKQIQDYLDALGG